MNYFDVLFAKKQSGGGGTPTLITKTITENGTYNASEDNADGYSQVTVAVEGFKKKSIANTPTDIASFNDGTANPMPSLEISIVPVQSGSGDPSPTNVRPISGWSAVTITDKDDLTNPTETKTVTIQLGQTVYGGELDVASGVLTVTDAMVDLGTLSWMKSSTSIFRAVVSNKKAGVSPLLCENYAYYADGGFAVTDKKISDTNSENYATVIFINDSSYGSDTATKFKDDMNGVQLVYELATPQTIQLTPTQVTTLFEQNNIFTDCGQILEGEYFVTL